VAEMRGSEYRWQSLGGRNSELDSGAARQIKVGVGQPKFELPITTTQAFLHGWELQLLRSTPIDTCTAIATVLYLCAQF